MQLETYDERPAFAALCEHLEKAEEAAIVIGANRSDGRWAAVAENMRIMREKITQLAIRRMVQ